VWAILAHERLYLLPFCQRLAERLLPYRCINPTVVFLMLVHFGFRLVEEVKEACSIVLEAEEIYMNTRCCVLTNNSYLYL